MSREAWARSAAPSSVSARAARSARARHCAPRVLAVAEPSTRRRRTADSRSCRSARWCCSRRVRCACRRDWVTRGVGNWLAAAILLGVGTAMVYPTLLAAIGALLAGLLADVFGIPIALAVVAARMRAGDHVATR